MAAAVPSRLRKAQLAEEAEVLRAKLRLEQGYLDALASARNSDVSAFLAAAEDESAAESRRSTATLASLQSRAAQLEKKLSKRNPTHALLEASASAEPRASARGVDPTAGPEGPASARLPRGAGASGSGGLLRRGEEAGDGEQKRRAALEASIRECVQELEMRAATQQREIALLKRKIGYAKSNIEIVEKVFVEGHKAPPSAAATSAPRVGPSGAPTISMQGRTPSTTSLSQMSSIGGGAQGQVWRMERVFWGLNEKAQKASSLWMGKWNRVKEGLAQSDWAIARLAESMLTAASREGSKALRPGPSEWGRGTGLGSGGGGERMGTPGEAGSGIVFSEALFEAVEATWRTREALKEKERAVDSLLRGTRP